MFQFKQGKKVFNHSKLVMVFFIISLVITTFLRAEIITRKRTINHDEGISYLCATGHEGSYSLLTKNGQPPFGTWVKVSEWKKFLQLKENFCFKKISFDLAHYDIHPPLYFWLLHLWSMIFGVEVWTGPSLNILIALLTAISLFGLASYVLGDSLEASLVVFTWALSPAVIITSFDARQYDLLALFTVLFVWQILKCSDLSKDFSWKDLFLLTILTTGGTLTHYHFSLVVIGCVVFSLIKLIKKNRYRLLMEFISIGAGYGIFFILHPHFYLSLSYLKRLKQVQPFRYEDLLLRVGVVRKTYSLFLGIWRPLKFMLILCVLVALTCWIFVIFKKRLKRVGSFTESSWKGVQIIYFLLWTSGINISLYLSFLSPGHAMGPRYLSMVWPFLAFIPILVFRFVPRFKAPLMIFFCIGLLFSSILTLRNSSYVNNRSPDPSLLLKNSTLILADSTARGIFPRIFWHIPHNKLIFAASQDYLLKNPDKWLDHLQSGALYISAMGYGNSKEKQREILRLIRKNYKVIPIEGGIWGFGEIYKLKKLQG
jgi:hypothetical protein